jgi:hypothetical protein
MAMKTLVTGAAGFIGLHFTKKLLEQGIEVVGVDNINDYYDVNFKYAPLNKFGINCDEIINKGAFLKSVLSLHPVKTSKADVFNSGNFKIVDLVGFITEFEQLLGKKVVKKLYLRQDWNVKKTFADTSYFTGITRDRPKVNLNTGLSNFVSCF